MFRFSAKSHYISPNGCSIFNSISPKCVNDNFSIRKHVRNYTFNQFNNKFKHFKQRNCANLVFSNSNAKSFTHGLGYTQPCTTSNNMNILPMRCYSEWIRSDRKLRNVAIIAHVDVGKTTLVDGLLKQSNSVKVGEKSMDSMDLERERGITIMSKITSVLYNSLGGEEYHINIVDTPGHADFGGEVERVVDMVDGVVLLVDATDGPMTQTRYVLQKALNAGLKAIVVINKVDMGSARPSEVQNEVFDLFLDLDATEEQLDIPFLFGSAREGWLVEDWRKTENKQGFIPLFEALLEYLPSPKIQSSENGKPFKMLVTSVEYDRHFGRMLTGKIACGTLKKGDKIRALSMHNNEIESVKITQIMGRRGFDKYPVESAEAGDLVSVAGFPNAGVTDTLCSNEVIEALPTKEIDPPLISVGFMVNDSPLAGREGKQCSALQLRDRLTKEAENNVSLRIKPDPSGDSVQVSARGEMQLGILLETMRREGYEFQVSTPKVLYKRDKETNTIYEPIEEVIITIDRQYTAKVMELMNNRQGEMISFSESGAQAKMVFEIPTRCLIGFNSEIKQECKGSGTVNHIFKSYEEFRGFRDSQRKGPLIALSSGKATSFSLQNLESRGTLFITPGVDVYEGMIIGENSREGEMVCNPAKTKHLTNMRSAGKEDLVRLSPPRIMTLEEALTYIDDDELIEVTPSTFRLRKKILNETERKKRTRKGKMAELEESVTEFL